MILEYKFEYNSNNNYYQSYIKNILKNLQLAEKMKMIVYIMEMKMKVVT